MAKIFYFDVETTGLNPFKNGIIQLSGEIEIDGKTMEQFNYKVKPFPNDALEPEALNVSGTSLKDIEGFEEPLSVYSKLTNSLSKYCNKYDTNDKYYPAGFNVAFDISFLKSFFVKCNDNYYGSWFNYRSLDPLPVFNFLQAMGETKELPNLKLETIANYYGIEIKAHDAMSDINATKEVIKKVFSMLNPCY